MHRDIVRECPNYGKLESNYSTLAKFNERVKEEEEEEEANKLSSISLEVCHPPSKVTTAA